jgi:predicted DNA-binding transcriptional regulator AlpA
MNTGEQLLSLLSDPERVDDLEPAAIPAIVGELETLRARLWVRLQAAQAPAVAAPSSNGEADHLLTAKEAAPLLGVAPRWMYRHADDLPFARRLTGGTLRFSARGLERWKESRR